MTSNPKDHSDCPPEAHTVHFPFGIEMVPECRDGVPVVSPDLAERLREEWDRHNERQEEEEEEDGSDAGPWVIPDLQAWDVFLFADDDAEGRYVVVQRNHTLAGSAERDTGERVTLRPRFAESPSESQPLYAFVRRESGHLSVKCIRSGSLPLQAGGWHPLRAPVERQDV